MKWFGVLIMIFCSVISFVGGFYFNNQLVVQELNNTIISVTELVNATCDVRVEKVVEVEECHNEELLARTEYVDELKKVSYTDDLNAKITLSNLGSKANIEFNRPVYLSAPNHSMFSYCNSHSMSPAIDCTKTLIVYKPKTEELRVGDVVIIPTTAYVIKDGGVTITPGWKSEMILHRIVRINDTEIMTKGDNNDYADGYWIPKKKVVFKVWQ